MAEKIEYKPHWEVFRNSARVAHGPEETMPDAEERKKLRATGHTIKVNGKLFAK